MAQLVMAGEFVGPGEERSARHLEQNLPQNWLVICNKELVNRDGSVREVDFIVVGQHTVFVIEEKSWSGPIHGNENGWVLRTGESHASPLRNADANSRRLAGMLRSGVPGLAEDTHGRHFVFGRVLLSSDNVQVFVHDPRKHDGVLRLEDAVEELQRFDKLQNLASISRFRAKIGERLVGLQDRPKVPRQIGDYQVLETIGGVGPIRAFRARHADGSERVLKLIQRPSTADEERRAADKNRLLREYNALKQLSVAARAPAVDPFFSWDQDQFWVVPIHPVGGRSLRADRTAATPQASDAVARAAEAFAAIREVHAAGVIHRALNPDRVHVLPSGRVSFSEFVIARLEGERTVASSADELDPDDTYRAPECRVDMALAVSASDVYSLAASLLFWIDGQEPGENLPTEWMAPLPGDDEKATLLQVLAECLVEDERLRPDATDVASRLSTILADRAVPPVPAVRREAFGPGEAIDDQHEVVRILGRGGSAVTYLAVDHVIGGYFVLKTILDPELVGRLTKNEFSRLRDLSHPCLPRVFDVRPPGHPFHLKLEYVPGSSLREIGSRNADLALVERVGRDVLDALGYLHERNLLHRDVSPGNIIVPEEEIERGRLIDFGLAADTADRGAAVGTPRYRPPEVDRSGRWTPQGDLYSLGVVLFELLTGRLPYSVDGGASRKAVQPDPSSEEVSRYGSLLDVLMKATRPDPLRRYQTAGEFARALRDASSPAPAPEPEGEERVNPTVDALRGLYRNSRLGNADNRGLDTTFASETYVPTRLDTDLLPQILRGEHRLVVLTGNPGDGKTAFLQRVRAALLEDGGNTERDDPAGWSIRAGSHRFAAVNDASESDGNRSADDLMHQALAPLAGDGGRPGGYTALVAANDGRLLDFFERFGTDRYRWLNDQLFGPGAERAGVTLVDLKHRSMVGYVPGEPSLLTENLDRFVAPERWAVCEGCVARRTCPMRFNALSFSNPGLAPTVRAHLHRLLLAVHLRRDRRPTLRDLRSAVAFLVTHDFSCMEVHAERHSGKGPLSRTRTYFDAAFNGTGGPDLLLDAWALLDPGDVPEPALDRNLYFHRDDSEPDALAGAFASSEERPFSSIPDQEDAPRDWLRGAKRRYVFEPGLTWTSLGRSAEPENLLPYRYFGEFVRLLAGDTDSTERMPDLLRGIAAADGVPEPARGGDLALRVTPRSEDALAVVKRFPAEQFRLQVGSNHRDAYAQGVADLVVLEHVTGAPRLEIGLDLFEFLRRASDGYLAGVEEQGALSEDLAAFKHQLLAQPTRDAVIVEYGIRFHSVRVKDGMISREEVVQ